jgi:hypothetical protein
MAVILLGYERSVMLASGCKGAGHACTAACVLTLIIPSKYGVIRAWIILIE